MKFSIAILTFFLLLSISTHAQRRKDDYKEKRVLREERYHPNGQLKYKNKTIRKGVQPDNSILGNQIIKLKEYYDNGQIRLKEKKKLYRIVEDQHLVEDRHILKQKKEFRKYKIWNREGDLIEKGKYTSRGNKRIVKYNVMNHKKVIITFDKEVGRDVITKKKPIYKTNNKIRFKK